MADDCRTEDQNCCYTVGIGPAARVIKELQTRERYETEVFYLERFRDMGFAVPALLARDDERMIVVLERIEGRKPHRFSGSELRQCLEVMGRVAERFGVARDRAHLDRYMDRLQENIRAFAASSSLDLSEAVLEQAISDLEGVGLVSLFKDAKPRNWIFTLRGVVMIDFDYVRRSFFLSDLAQLVTWLATRQEIDVDAILRDYLAIVAPTIRDPGPFRRPFALAMVQSNLASMRHNGNLSTETRRSFALRCAALLRALGLVGEGRRGGAGE